MGVEDATKDDRNKINSGHPDCDKTVQGGKTILSKKTEKTYKVTVTYVQLSDEEASIKRAIIESIMKKGCKQKDV